jgi:general secretion pathway protein N
MAGWATLHLTGVSAKISPVKPLGDYVLNANAAGEGFALTLASGDGPLKLSGSGRWQAGSGLKLAGEAEAGSPQAQALKPVLLLLGRELTSGRVSWQIGS